MKPCDCVRSRRHREAFTLIEVMAGITLMAVLLTSVLMAYGRHNRQIRKAHERLVAVRACDDLISDWIQQPSVYSGRTSGTFAGRSDFRWRVIPVVSAEADIVDAQILRWEVYKLTKEGSAERITKVDLLIARPEPSDKEGTHEGQVQ